MGNQALSQKLEPAKKNIWRSGFNTLMTFVEFFSLFRKTSLKDLKTFIQGYKNSPEAINWIEYIIEKTNSQISHWPKVRILTEGDFLIGIPGTPLRIQRLDNFSGEAIEVTLIPEFSPGKPLTVHFPYHPETGLVELVGYREYRPCQLN